MSDPPVRHGPPAPPGLTGDQPIDADPFASDDEPGPMADAVVAGRPAVARRELRLSPHTGSAVPPFDLNRLGLIALVVAFALAAIWFDRDRHDPVAGLGIVPQPGASNPPPAHSTLAVGDPAPNFRLRTSDGDIVELAGVRGQPVLLHFWTTWCLVCTGEMPALQEFANAHAGNLHILGVNAGEDSGRVGAAADTNGATYPMLLDRDLAVTRGYGIEDYPVTIVIDASGTIASIDIVALSPEELDSRLAAVLGT